MAKGLENERISESVYPGVSDEELSAFQVYENMLRQHGRDCKDEVVAEINNLTGVDIDEIRRKVLLGQTSVRNRTS